LNREGITPIKALDSTMLNERTPRRRSRPSQEGIEGPRVQGVEAQVRAASMASQRIETHSEPGQSWPGHAQRAIERNGPANAFPAIDLHARMSKERPPH